MVDDKNETIVSIDRDIIEQFLLLIRDKFPLVDKANYFLERNCGVSGINIAIVNQRDFLSYFCSVLKNNDLSREDQMHQVAAAEEHLRRAIGDSYKKALSIQLVKVKQIYEDYKAYVLPIREKQKYLMYSPDFDSVNDTLKKIDDLRNEASTSYTGNRWDEGFEKYVKKYIDAFLLAKELAENLEKFISLVSEKDKQATISRRNFWLYWSVLANTVTLVLILWLVLR